MVHRRILTARQRADLFDLPTDEAALRRHYTLADDDLESIHARRRPTNQMGFAVQLCALRYPGRLLRRHEIVPEDLVRFIAVQIGLQPDDLLPYAARSQTRHEHLTALRDIYGYRMFTGAAADELKSGLIVQAAQARSNEDLVRQFTATCRARQIILPGISVIERLCADALVAAERQIEARIAGRLDAAQRLQLDALLNPDPDGHTSRFVWLRQFETGNNSADVNRLLDRLDTLQSLSVPPDCLNDVPPHRITLLRRQGERYFTDGLREISEDRRLAILAVCVIEWRKAIADAVVDTHDRIVGKLWNDAQHEAVQTVEAAHGDIRLTLTAFRRLGTALLTANRSHADLLAAVETACGWESLESLVTDAGSLTDTVKADPLEYIAKGDYRFRLYAPRMLKALDIRGASVAAPLLEAIDVIREDRAIPAGSPAFLRPRSNWRQRFRKGPADAHDRLWRVAVLCHVREGFRSGDVWLPDSRQYADLQQSLVPIETARAVTRLAIPHNPEDWIHDRRQRLETSLDRLATAARNDTLP